MLKPQSTRDCLFRKMLEVCPSYLKHYIELDDKYNNKNEIFFEYLCKLKDNIRKLASSSRYKYHMYLKINIALKPSIFINDIRCIASKIIKFRQGNHYLPIEMRG